MIPNSVSRRNILRLNYWNTAFGWKCFRELLLCYKLSKAGITLKALKWSKPNHSLTAKSKLDTWRLSYCPSFLGCFLTHFLRNSVWWESFLIPQNYKISVSFLSWVGRSPRHFEGLCKNQEMPHQPRAWSEALSTTCPSPCASKPAICSTCPKVRGNINKKRKQLFL